MNRKHIKKLPGRPGDHPHPWHFRCHDTELDGWIATFCTSLEQQGIDHQSRELDDYVRDFVCSTFYQIKKLMFSKEIVDESNFKGLLTNTNCDHLDPETISLLRMMCFRCVVTGKRWPTDFLTTIKEHGIE